MQINVDQVVGGDIGVDLEVDTELSSLSGYSTLTLQLYYDDTLMGEYTAADGGDGPIGKLLTYTTTQADHDDDDIFAATKLGDWYVVPHLVGAGKDRHGTPALRVTCVKVGT